MSAPPAASVVVPLLRQRGEWLGACVRSALEQTAPCEVLVVISPRTPAGNRSLLERLGGEADRFRVLVQPPGGGFAEAINLGLEAAGADRVGLLLSDDWLDASAVEACLERDADIVSTGRTLYLADGGTEVARRVPSRARYDALADPEARAAYLGHFFLFARHAALGAGGVDPAVGLTGADDYDLVWTMLERGATVELVERPLYNYRDHGEERLTLRAREAQLRDLGRVLDKHGVHGPRRARLLERHGLWYGRPIHEVLAEDGRWTSHEPRREAARSGGSATPTRGGREPDPGEGVIDAG